MNTVECPKCTLRFEPDELMSLARTDVFCPQCGNCFSPGFPRAGEVENLSAWQTA